MDNSDKKMSVNDNKRNQDAGSSFVLYLSYGPEGYDLYLTNSTVDCYKELVAHKRV